MSPEVIQKLKETLQKALNECDVLKRENEQLRARLGLPPLGKRAVEKPVLPELITKLGDKFKVFSKKKKITIFRNLFKGREDIYPVRWENRKGQSGYAPACLHDWDCPLCRDDRKNKRSRCENRKFLPLKDEVIEDHLTGKKTLGVYPLLQDETCWFLAVDFDKQNWQEDVLTYLSIAKAMNIPAYLERSRSGKGGHIWIFFEIAIPAITARKMGSALLTKAMEQRHQIGFDSYDRFFPSQDTMPKGGFGNLIALPLQKVPREHGNSLFLDEKLQPIPNQWDFLSQIQRVSFESVRKIVREASESGTLIGVQMSSTDEEKKPDPWTLPPSQKRKTKPFQGPLPEKIDIVVGNMLYLKKANNPPALLNRILRLAAFQNPEFYRAQAMRLSTYNKARIISCGEDFPEYIGLPRGSLEDLLHFLKEHKIKANIEEKWCEGEKINISFQGKLRPLQNQAVQKLLEHDNGVLSAGTGFGKTVIGAKLIAKRKVNTLILVHRSQLMDQWVEQLTLFLDPPKGSIGQFGGGKKKLSNVIDVAMLQSLNKKGVIHNLVANYGHVIVDECHHISAFSFEQVLRQVKARYVTGLTATPIRKDGHHPIIMMQCGPIRFRVDAKKQVEESPFEHFVIPRYTNVSLKPEMMDAGIQEVYAELVADESRNDLIFNDLLSTLEAGYSPLLLTERTEHVGIFEKRLKKFAKNVIVLKGGMGKKQRTQLADKLKRIPDHEERVLISTGRYIGEGFDDARLDTLFLAMPISWRGTLQQYVGRLHRLHNNKDMVQVYDYVDFQVPMLKKMYERRFKGYHAIGYKVKKE